MLLDKRKLMTRLHKLAITDYNGQILIGRCCFSMWIPDSGNFLVRPCQTDSLKNNWLNFSH